MVAYPGIGQQVAVASLDNPATHEQTLERRGPRTTIQGIGQGDPAFGVLGSGSDDRRLAWGEF
jgi:hypothetical protein